MGALLGSVSRLSLVESAKMIRRLVDLRLERCVNGSVKVCKKKMRLASPLGEGGNLGSWLSESAGEDLEKARIPGVEIALKCGDDAKSVSPVRMGTSSERFGSAKLLLVLEAMLTLTLMLTP